MAYIIVAILLWSSLGIIIRYSGVSPQLLIFASCIISTSIISTFFIKRSFREAIPKGKSLLYFLAIGPVSLINSYTFFYSYQNTTIANAVLTHYTAPIVVAFFAPFFLKERLSFKIFVSIALATIGLWIMLDISIIDFFKLLIAGDKNTYGIMAGLISGIAYGALIIMFRFFAQNFNPIIITFFQNIIIVLILLPFIELPLNFSSVLWAFIIVGVIHSTLAPILYFKGMRHVTANKTAILGYLEPVSAIILGAIFLNEMITYKVIIGGVLILFSGYITISKH
ncbi:MAG: DMT family transporter [Thermodesulfovibrionales bacterium]|nr:DMT family transporter [Thermodesulfovibrionales bacterium]